MKHLRGCFAVFLLAIATGCIDFKFDGIGQQTSTRCDRSNILVDFPFNYTLTNDALMIHTDGGDVRVVIHPAGAHVPGFTGHGEGNAKSDWVGLLASHRSDLVELVNNGTQSGVCEKNDICGMSLADVLSRSVSYISPLDQFSVEEVRVESIDTNPTIFDNTTWRISASVCGYRFTLGHVRAISDILRNKMIAAGYSDPKTITDVSGNLITGQAIVLDKGDVIAHPQIRMQEVSGHPGYYRGTGVASPWAQIEYYISDNYLSEDEDGYDHPIYRLFSQQVQDKLYQTMVNEYLDPDSKYFQSNEQPWLVNAELVLYTTPKFRLDDYSSIYGALGGWWEKPVGICNSWVDAKCDQTFSFFKIFKNTVAYNSSLYYNADVNYLVYSRGKIAGSDIVIFGELLSPAEPNELSDTLVMRWHRSTGFQYQAVSYRVFPNEKKLTMRWSTIENNLVDLVLPSVPEASDVCDGEVITCFGHDNF